MPFFKLKSFFGQTGVTANRRVKRVKITVKINIKYSLPRIEFVYILFRIPQKRNLLHKHINLEFQQNQSTYNLFFSNYITRSVCTSYLSATLICMKFWWNHVSIPPCQVRAICAKSQQNRSINKKNSFFGGRGGGAAGGKSLVIVI